MRRGSLLVCALVIALGVGIPPSVAQEGPGALPPPTKAERISDRAFGSMVAWKVGAAESLLGNNEKELATTPEYKTALGYLRAIQGNAEEGVALLQEAAKAKPTDPAPQFYLGEIQYWRQQSDAAATAWKAARDRARPLAEANNADARSQYYLGAAQIRLKQFGPGRKALTAARDAGFDPVLVDYQLGFSYILEEKWQDAVTAFDAVAEKDSKIAHLYFYRGLAWGKLDRKDKMLVDMDQFVKLAPNAPEAAVAGTYLAAAKR
jgi:tetratricopeptide (TPR) repeat protein